MWPSSRLLVGLLKHLAVKVSGVVWRSLFNVNCSINRDNFVGIAETAHSGQGLFVVALRLKFVAKEQADASLGTVVDATHHVFVFHDYYLIA